MNDQRIQRLRTWFLILLVVVVIAGAAVPIAVTQYLDTQVDEAQFDITCTSAHANIDQLQALRSIARELGIPASFDIPEVPDECE